MHTLATPITKLFGIKYPILLAGMNVAAGPELAAAVTNAGGLGVIGGVGYTPAFLKKQIEFLKAGLKDPNAPFGIDLLLPQVGEGARATNFDYTKGTLPELIDIICHSGAKLFVSAVGVPPRWAVDKLHEHKIPVMNMIGAPKHAKKAINAGVDIICAQGGEGGGHTGDVPTSMLIPVVVDLVRGHNSPLTGEQIPVVAAGGIFDGRGLAMALALGAEAVWVGTRFVCSEEAGAPQRHKDAIVAADFSDTVRTLIFTGRPMRVLKNDYIMDWETNRSKEILALTGKGVLPYQHDIDEAVKSKEGITAERMKEAMEWRPMLTGQVAGAIHEIKPAAEIINDMVRGAVEAIRRSNSRLAKL
jgi:NAD(P)H-dependent flavin oxidoreductase YrpB (nitropropane dioxygenase family)